MVFYRKYRPQTIGQLDSINVKEILYAVLRGKEVPHAFLFTGPKGLGKTSTARIVAKVVNCENIKNGEPCNTCEQCVSITNGTNVDALEIDGASNRGIDEVRELRERVKLSPSSARKKVYIIDEVHMLTTEAFNALLKTIEEPPSHVMFIFCTTEPHKVPATILSRCFHISFSLATEEELVNSLKRIALGEDIKIDKESLETIAQMADGGFRDAAKILEETVMLHGKEITKEHFTHTTASVLFQVKSLFENLHAQNTQKALGIIEAVVKEGVDLKFFTQQILSQLHSMLLEQANIIKNDTRPNKLQFSIEQISLLYNLFSHAYLDIKVAAIPQLPIEIAISIWGEENFLDTHNTYEQTVSPKHTIETLLKKQQNMKVKNILYPQKQEKISVEKPVVDQPDMISRPSDEMVALMENIIYKVKSYNSSIAGVLRSCKIKKIVDGTVVFEAAYAFHKERLEDTKTCEIIEKVVKEITGKQLRLVAVLKGGEK